MDTLAELLRRNATHAESFQDRFDDVQEGQWPEAVTVCCSDSRVLQDEMWGNEVPGYLFTVGNIGNRVGQRQPDPIVSGDVLYPLTHTGTETAIVVGHTGCGAVTATYDALTGDVSDASGIEHCIDLLRPHVDPGVESLPDGLDRPDAINHLVEYNVDRQVKSLVESDDVPEETKVAGAVYDFQDIYGGKRGEIHVVNIGGERDVETLRQAHPELADRIRRLWEY